LKHSAKFIRIVPKFDFIGDLYELDS